MGLLQASRPEIDDYMYSLLPRFDSPTPPRPLESCLWKEDYSKVFGSPIWMQFRLGVVNTNPNDENNVAAENDKFSGAVINNMVPHEALIWAKDVHELERLTRLSGYTVSGKTLSDSSDSMPALSAYLLGLRAYYTAEQEGITPKRTVGALGDKKEEAEDASVHFDIDGAGGELVSEVFVALHEGQPKAIKVRNRTAV
jgi:hypothetical protein